MHAFDVLGDPIRRRILELLTSGETTSGLLTEAVRAEFGVTQPAVSQHLRVLRDTGFANVRPEGTRRLYTIRGERMAEVDEWVQRFRPFWEKRPDGLVSPHPPQDRERHRTTRDTRASDMTDHQRTQRTLEATTLRGAPARAVVLRREFPEPISGVWDACTSSERLGRWVGPVSGDFTVGGRYQLEGNAGGIVEVCEKPNRLRVTWEFDDAFSVVEVHLSETDLDRTAFELAHVCAAVDDDHWITYGPGAAGVGWDIMLIALEHHLGTGTADFDGAAWTASAQGRASIAAASSGWARAHIADGAPADVARTAGERTRAFYTGDDGS
ncbi:ArsR/SmtB family transcription factor [Nocardiopsis ansamitocini]|uniref:HTH arsR-type domain-containing protein n=1 Tax=Nocardiopsis ansamitocini TaxID=1670832 RepID=A0A9W6P8S2_9ACTN|nr:metalloregulator ArsR/SmtB family transcription factor [Nocardiopsis ansamitocini]GLU49086.1 hypothetical protein Nans01_34370 [Nocardiopsis ansamitocini]